MKRIVATIKEGPNYVFHLAALACAGFRSDYTDIYEATVPADDLETLRKYGSRTNFGLGSGHGGDLPGLLVFETGFTWKYPSYEIVLCSALKDGPQANSLGYERNTFYHDYDLGWTTDFISHEVGTHIMMKIMVAEAALGKHEYGMSPQYHCEEFRAVYEEVSAREPGVTPARLLSEGLYAFKARYPEAV